MTELDSAWQSLYALNHVRDRKLRMLLFRHAIEELEHSDLFSGLARNLEGVPSAVPTTRRKPLVEFDTDEKKSTLRFLAALCAGENEIRGDFRCYLRSIPDQKVTDVLSKISVDEDGHADGSRRALEGAAQREGVQTSKLLRKENLSLIWRRYQSVGMKAGGVLMSAGLLLAYFLFAPFAFGQARRRLSMSYAEQLKLQDM